jgi:ribosomal protein S18 acetylase RimI-like enzyme
MSDTIDIIALDPAALTDATDALAEILKACVHEGASVGFVLPHDSAEARAFWTEKTAPALAAGTRVVLVAKHGGAIAGAVQLNLDTMPNQPHRADVMKLLVHPRFRRRGLARALMRAIEAEAARAGRWLLTLDTAGEAAERLYLSLGYISAGIVPFYARDPLVDRFDTTTIMYKDLRPPLTHA